MTQAIEEQSCLKKFEPWYGEFGWEVMTWVPYLRKIAEDLPRQTAVSFKGMGYLYEDFADFEAHEVVGRSLTFLKKYRVKGKYFKYGTARHKKDVLIHARGIQKSSFKNYKSWEQFEIDAGWIGTREDQCFGEDLRGTPLKDLADYIAGAKVVVGQSSGLMHFALMCGTPVIVWGDDRSYFGEKLERRYKETWNPFKTDVRWIRANWQPEPEEVINECRSFV